jgi:hypothetical protein
MKTLSKSNPVPQRTIGDHGIVENQKTAAPRRELSPHARRQESSERNPGRSYASFCTATWGFQNPSHIPSAPADAQFEDRTTGTLRPNSLRSPWIEKPSVQSDRFRTSGMRTLALRKNFDAVHSEPKPLQNLELMLF